MSFLQTALQVLGFCDISIHLLCHESLRRHLISLFFQTMPISKKKAEDQTVFRDQTESNSFQVKQMSIQAESNSFQRPRKLLAPQDQTFFFSGSRLVLFSDTPGKANAENLQQN